MREQPRGTSQQTGTEHRQPSSSTTAVVNKEKNEVFVRGKRFKKIDCASTVHTWVSSLLPVDSIALNDSKVGYKIATTKLQSQRTEIRLKLVES
jgi:hypothetical protein